VFLNLRSAKANESLKMYLEKPSTTMSGAGAQARKEDTETNYIGKAFDAVIYLNHVNAIKFKE